MANSKITRLTGQLHNPPFKSCGTLVTHRQCPCSHNVLLFMHFLHGFSAISSQMYTKRTCLKKFIKNKKEFFDNLWRKDCTFKFVLIKTFLCNRPLIRFVSHISPRQWWLEINNSLSPLRYVQLKKV